MALCDKMDIKGRLRLYIRFYHFRHAFISTYFSLHAHDYDGHLFEVRFHSLWSFINLYYLIIHVYISSVISLFLFRNTVVS